MVFGLLGWMEFSWLLFVLYRLSFGVIVCFSELRYNEDGLIGIWSC